MGEQRSAVGFLANWLETSPRPDKSILVSPKSSEVEEQTLPGLLACCPDAETEYLSQTVSKVAAGHSVIALYPEEKIAESIVDRVDPTTADLCITLWPGFDQLEMWLEAHGAIQLPSGMPADTSFIERLDPVVRVAIARPHDVMSEHGGIRNGRGKDEIVQTLRLLHKNGYTYRRHDLQLFAYRLGYRQRDVEQLGTYVDSIRENRRLQTGPDRLRPDILDLWKSEAEDL
ncbi:hypothetical protein AL755_18105 [Arthrobacter sp. ERGS1:01]|nr:hypothetical protein AL755_18105 [Arthrobacter sp. ERGS1:01]